MKKIFLIIGSIAVINVWSGFIDTYDECNKALDICLRSNDPNYRSAASACVDAGGIWTGQKCPQFGGDWCKNKCSHGKLGLVDYITTAKGCGICKFINDSIDSAYSKTGQFKAGTEVPFAATFVHRKLCSVKTGTEADSYAFDQKHTDSSACKWLYWKNSNECPNPGDDSKPYGRITKIEGLAFKAPWIRPSESAQLEYITVAPNGSLWGVNFSGEVYTSSDQGVSWSKPNAVARFGVIAVSPDGTLWGIGGSTLYMSKDNGVTWQGPLTSPLAGKKIYLGIDVGTLVYITVAPNGDLWVITKGTVSYLTQGYHIFKSSDKAQTWQGPLNGSLKNITVAPNGNIWGVNAEDVIFVSSDDTKTWQVPSAGRLSFITAAPNGDLWGVNGAGEIFASTDEGKTWNKPPNDAYGALFKFVAVAPNGNVWGVNSFGQIFKKVDEGK